MEEQNKQPEKQLEEAKEQKQEQEVIKSDKTIDEIIKEDDKHENKVLYDETKSLAKLKEEFDNKVEEITIEKNNAIKERDDVIKQLLNGKSIAKPKQSIADKINTQRNYKKW